MFGEPFIVYKDSHDLIRTKISPTQFRLLYEGKSLNNRNFILKCMEKYAQRKILFRDTKWLLSNMSHRGRDDQAF